MSTLRRALSAVLNGIAFAIIAPPVLGIAARNLVDAYRGEDPGFWITTSVFLLLASWPLRRDWGGKFTATRTAGGVTLSVTAATQAEADLAADRLIAPFQPKET